jgi:hypothetical protein
MSKPIPPPPPAHVIKHRPHTQTPSHFTEALDRITRPHAPLPDELVEGGKAAEALDRLDMQRSGGQTAPGGKPAVMGSNFPAVTSALGMMSEKQARWRVEKDNSKSEWNGVTSRHIHTTPRLTDSTTRSYADGK